MTDMDAAERALRERLSHGMGEAVKWTRDNQADWLEACDKLAGVALPEIRQAHEKGRQAGLEEAKRLADRQAKMFEGKAIGWHINVLSAAINDCKDKPEGGQ